MVFPATVQCAGNPCSCKCQKGVWRRFSYKTIPILISRCIFRTAPGSQTARESAASELLSPMRASPGQGALGWRGPWGWQDLAKCLLVFHGWLQIWFAWFLIEACLSWCPLHSLVGFIWIDSDRAELTMFFLLFRTTCCSWGAWSGSSMILVSSMVGLIVFHLTIFTIDSNNNLGYYAVFTSQDLATTNKFE